MKPFAESCEQNKLPILTVLRNEFTTVKQVLEIGSGTGQHAVLFARELPHLVWHTSDVRQHHAGIQAWIDDQGSDNMRSPLTLDVADTPSWPGCKFDGVFSANTVHIMGWPEVEAMFTGIGRVLLPGGRFCLYGPFNVEGRFTAPSNARFDTWLKQQDPRSGIRDMAALNRLATAAGLAHSADHAMPTNNRILVWKKDTRGTPD
jgi:cyclopropane fatty-acyl-phospholipid synthase-like methyltransferase